MDLLAAMRIYVRVVERGSMSAAARDLGIGQPAVSERIERIEATLGVRLLRRNTRAISVTDMGAAFYERSKTAIEAADDALSVAQDGVALRGSLRIAAPHGLGEMLLPPVLLRLREQHPALRIDLVLNDRVVDPLTEGVDLSLRLGELGEGSFAARRLGRVRRLLVAAPAYLDRHGMPEQPEDLGRHAFARVSGLFGGDRLPLSAPDGQIIKIPIDVALTVSHWRPLHALILGGGAIGVLQQPVCTSDLNAGRLKQLLPSFSVRALDLHLLYGAGRPVAPRIRAVMSLLEEETSRWLSGNHDRSTEKF
jgi:DNA-binding transcriptional LysR family regulator